MQLKLSITFFLKFHTGSDKLQLENLMDCYKDVWNVQRKNAKAFGHSWIVTAHFQVQTFSLHVSSK